MMFFSFMRKFVHSNIDKSLMYIIDWGDIAFYHYTLLLQAWKVREISFGTFPEYFFVNRPIVKFYIVKIIKSQVKRLSF